MHDTVIQRRRSLMPDIPRGADRTKVLSVRLTAEELDALTARATEVGVGPSTLARTFVRQALAGTQRPSTAQSSTPPPRDSSLEAHLQTLIDADLVARVEALERRAAED